MPSRKIHAEIGKRIAEFAHLIKDFEIKLKLYRVLLSGKSFEFDGFREYTGYDDASLIDWKATMRGNKLLVRKYREEQNLKIMFLIDVGDNMVFGSAKKLKCEYAAEVAATLAYLIKSVGDKFGYLLFNNKVVYYSNCKKTNQHFTLFVDKITNASVYASRGDMANAITWLTEHTESGIASVIIISDFSNLTKAAENQLAILAKRYETICVVIKDALDKRLPNIKHAVVIADPTGSKQQVINPSALREEYKQAVMRSDKKLKSFFLRNRIDSLELLTSIAFVPTLVAFLKGIPKEAKGGIK